MSLREKTVKSVAPDGAFAHIFRYFRCLPYGKQDGYLGDRGGFRAGRDSRYGCLGKQLSDAVGELCSVAGPVVDAVALEVDRGRSGAGIVDADHLDGAAVAGAVLFNDNDAIVGLLACAYAR